MEFGSLGVGGKVEEIRVRAGRAVVSGRGAGGVGEAVAAAAHDAGVRGGGKGRGVVEEVEANGAEGRLVGSKDAGRAEAAVDAGATRAGVVKEEGIF